MRVRSLVGAAASGEGTDGGWSDLVIEVGPTEALRAQVYPSSNSVPGPP